MATSEGTFGGDGSVNWQVNAKNVKPGSAHSFKKKWWDARDREYSQIGHDGTAAGSDFTIIIKVPASNPQGFLDALKQAATDATGQSVVTFTLPIESHNEDQIRIIWDSVKEDGVPDDLYTIRLSDGDPRTGGV